MSVSIAGAAGGWDITSDALQRLCKAQCPGTLCALACDSCPHSRAHVVWPVG